VTFVGNRHVQGLPDGEAFVRRYTLSGALVWERTVGTTGDVVIDNVAASSSGIRVSGSSRQLPTDPPDPDPDSDWFVRHIDFDGSTRWTRALTAGAIAVDCASFVTAGSIAAAPGSGVYAGTSIDRTGADGDIEWRWERASTNDDRVAFEEVAVFGSRVYVVQEEWSRDTGETVHETAALRGIPAPTGCDTTPPCVSAPSHRLISGTAVNAGRVTVRLTWTGSDAASGIAGYSLEQQTDGGPWAVVAPALAGPTVDRLLAPQHSYRFRVSAVDQAGNPTGPVSGATFTLSRYSENNAKVAYSGRWKTSTSSVFWGGAARKSSSAGAKASLTFSGRSASWVARKGPDRGKAAVYVNGTKLATIDLYSPTYQSQRVVWAGTWSTSASRKLTIRVSGTSGRPRVDVDAFVTAN
jgi:hypothetical protein